MLCPEVWNFDSPSCSESTKLCQSEEDIFQTIKHQYFNHHISVILPDTLQVPKDLISPFVEDSQYYRINKVPVAEFTSKSFLDYFINRGRLTAISLNDFSEQNLIVLTPCGKLILSLSKNTFQELGVEGTFTKHSRSPLRKYIVVLDLTSNLSELKKKCEQVHKKLIACKSLTLDVILAWEPDNPNVCPSSIALFFSSKGYFVKTCDVIYKQMLKCNVTVPLYDDTDTSELMEWLGAFSLECDMSSDNYISSMKCPENNRPIGPVLHLTFTGLITYDRLKKFIFQINNYIQEKSSNMWISLTVQGFQDCVLRVKNKKLFLSSGDHHCTVIFRWNFPCLVYNFQGTKN